MLTHFVASAGCGPVGLDNRLASSDRAWPRRLSAFPAAGLAWMVGAPIAMTCAPTGAAAGAPTGAAVGRALATERGRRRTVAQTLNAVGCVTAGAGGPATAPRSSSAAISCGE